MKILGFNITRSAENPAAKMVKNKGRGILRSLFSPQFTATKHGRLEASWSTYPWTAGALIYMHWQTIVGRSRTACENEDLHRKFLQLVRDNVPGKNGFTLHSRPLDPNGKIDKAARLAIEAAYSDWAEYGNCDTTETLSLADMERLAIATVAKDGEIIGIKNYADGFRIQLVDPMLLMPNHFEYLGNGNTIRHGIEFTPTGKRVAYYFREYDEQQMGYVSYQRGASAFRRVAAEDVVHWFVSEIVGQKRGLPWTRTSIWRSRMLAGFMDAALVNARVGASKMGFFKDLSAEDDIEAEELPIEGDSGVFGNIGNREFVPWDPQFPNNETETFVRVAIRSLASGLGGISYHTLSNDLTNVNYSSIRQGALDEREYWAGLQSQMISGWVKPIFCAWLEYALLKQQIRLPSGAPLPWEKIDKYKRSAFAGRHWAWIDPGAETAAMEKMIAQKIESRSAFTRSMTGRDPAEVREEIESEDDEMVARGIVPLAPSGSAPITADDAQKPGAHETDPKSGKD